ncbi:MAG: hemerythrin domain-containing protein [Candidatus Nanopelagicales bacterium]
MKNPHEELNTVIHDSLRRDLGRLGAAVSTPMTDERRTVLCSHATWVLDVLHHHHVGEDEGVWPLVLSKRPDLQPLMDQMETEHDELATASDRLRQALSRYAADGSEPARQAVVAAVQDMMSATLSHLEHEERETMPLVLDTLDAGDWKYLEKNHFRKGVAFGEAGMTAMWWLDGLDEDRRWVVQKTIPKPVLWFMGRRFGPRYRRNCHIAWGTAWAMSRAGWP